MSMSWNLAAMTRLCRRHSCGMLRIVRMIFDISTVVTERRRCRNKTQHAKFHAGVSGQKGKMGRDDVWWNRHHLLYENDPSRYIGSSTSVRRRGPKHLMNDLTVRFLTGCRLSSSSVRLSNMGCNQEVYLW